MKKTSMKRAVLLAVVSLAFAVTGCSSSKLVKQYTEMAQAKAELAEAVDIGNSVELELTEDGKVQKVVFNDSRTIEAKARLLDVQMPETTMQTAIKAGASVANNVINQAGANAAVAGLTYLGKQITDMDRSSTVTTNTTTSGDTFGDNANNSGTMQTGDGRINSNDSTATPTVVNAPDPVVVQPQVVEPKVVQVPASNDSGSQ